METSLREQRSRHIDSDQWKFDLKLGALAWPALNQDGTAMLRYDPVGNGQAKSNASLLPAASLVDAVEAFEDSLLLVGSDSHSRILNCDESRFFSNFERQANGSRRRSVL